MKAFVYYTGVLLILSTTGSFSSCKKFFDIDPPADQIAADYVFTNDQTAIAATSGLYESTMTAFGFLNGYMSKIMGLSADEIVRNPSLATEVNFYLNNIQSQDIIVAEVWRNGYSYIAQANTIIEKLNDAPGISADLRSQLAGISRFMRGLVYFYFVNLYGDVPLVLSTDVEANAILKRASKEQIYQQIITDLTAALQLLPEKYFETGSGSNGRTFPNKWAAAALLARVSLYTNEWKKAEELATTVIKSGSYRLTDVKDVFLSGSEEAIFQLKPVTQAFNTAEGAYFVPASAAIRPVYTLTPQLDSAFEKDDKRRTWVREITINNQVYLSPFKYKIYNSPLPYQEYNTVLRLGELFLIRAEAAARQGKWPSAIADLNVIRTRAGLPDLNASMSPAMVLPAIEQERRIELFAEWGHRWFDLKRWPGIINPASAKQRADEVIGSAKPGNWQSTDLLWPVPETELQKNVYLDQNPGY